DDRGGGLGLRIAGGEIHLRVEVVEGRRVRRLAVRRDDDAIAALAEEVAEVRGRAGDAVAVQHEQRGLGGWWRLCLLRLHAERRRGRLRGRGHVWIGEVLDRLLDVLGRGDQFGVREAVRLQAADLRPEDVPGGEPVGEQRVREDRPALDRAAAALADLDVLRDRVDQARESERRERASHLLL